MFAEFNAFKFNVSRFNSELLDAVFVEAIAMADARIADVSKPLTDSQFLQDNDVAKQPAKGFSETLRTGDWISIKRAPGQSDWEDS